MASKGGAVLMVCRTCGKKGGHWTSKCHYKEHAPPTEPICIISVGRQQLYLLLFSPSLLPMLSYFTIALTCLLETARDVNEDYILWRLILNYNEILMPETLCVMIDPLEFYMVLC
jgi:hypothetical protein